jgi:hypothetical protein
MRARRPLIVCCTTIAATALCVYLFAAETQEPVLKSPDLARRVAGLEQKVAQLEKTVAQLSVSANRLTVPPAVPLPGDASQAQPVPQAVPAIPPNATPHTYNGQTFYILPLGAQAAQ